MKTFPWILFVLTIVGLVVMVAFVIPEMDRKMELRAREFVVSGFERINENAITAYKACRTVSRNFNEELIKATNTQIELRREILSRAILERDQDRVEKEQFEIWYLEEVQLKIHMAQRSHLVGD